LIGFITGVYIPISLLPTGVQVISNILPVSQSAALLRQIFLDEPLQQVFAGAPEAMKGYADGQGVNLYLNGFELTATFMIFYIVGSIVIFGIINIIRFKKMKNN
jgi:multidrug/hemolysin transport system permease protein